MITNLKQEHTHTNTHCHFLVFLVQTGWLLALQSSMEQALFAVRMIYSGHVKGDSSIWEVAMNSKRAFAVLEGTAARTRSLLDPV